MIWYLLLIVIDFVNIDIVPYFFFSARLTMESNIPYIEIIPENSDVVTGTDGTNEETSSKGIIDNRADE